MTISSKNLPDVIVLDIGGSRTRIALWDGKNLSDITLYETPTFLSEQDQHRGIEENQKIWLQNLSQKVKSFRALHPTVSSASIGFAGGVSNDGSLYYGPNIWGTESHTISNEQLEEAFQLPVTVSNDMTAAIVRYGKSPEFVHYRHIYMLTVSTGIGSKMYDVQNQHVVLDTKGRIGEIGHSKLKSTTVQHEGKPLTGMLEQYASGEGVSRLAPIMAQANPDTYRSSLLASHLSDLEKTIETAPKRMVAKEILICARDDDPFALSVLRESVHHIAFALHIVLLVDAPDKIILMGGFAQHGGEMYRSLLVDELVQLDFHFYTPEELDNMIVLGIDDDNNGLIGAGMLVLTSGEEMPRQH